MLKKLLNGMMAIAVCVVGLSGCGESPPEEVETIRTETITHKTTTLSEKVQTTKPTETTTIETTSEETTTTEYELTEEDLQLLDSMPEIVFIISHHYSDTNIIGYYITKYGEMKMYDFRDRTEPIYNVLDVLDELESATCSEFVSLGGNTITQQDLRVVSKSELLNYYKALLEIDIESEIIYCEGYIDSIEGYGEFYGIRSNNEKHEIITLNGWGNAFKKNSDPNAEKIDLYYIFDGSVNYYKFPY